MKILFICHRIPYPPNKGEKLRALHLLRHLAGKHQVRLVALYDDPEDRRHAPKLEALCDKVLLFPLHPWLAKLRAMACLFRNVPLSLGFFYSGKMRAAVRAELREWNPDLVFGYCSSIAQYFIEDPRPKVMDFVDCDSEKWAQYSRRARFPMSWVYALERRRLQAYEDFVARRCAASLVVTQQERDRFARFADVSRFEVVANGVDMEFFRPSGENGGRKFVFTGAMDYRANVDGVQYFCREIFPLIRRDVPDAEFLIVGSKPTAAVRALGDLPGVRVTGFVEDVRVHFRQAAVCVVPLRIAEGIPNKILEGMAMGLPVIATSQAASGLKPGAERNILLADAPEDFAKKALALLADGSERKRLGESARRFVEEHYGWEANLKKIDEIVFKAAGPGAR